MIKSSDKSAVGALKFANGKNTLNNLTGKQSMNSGNGAIHYQFSKCDNPELLERNHDPKSKFNNLATDGHLAGSEKITYSMYRMDVELVGANKNAQIETEEKTAYYENYFTPNTGENGATAHAYNRITYKNVYPNIDWVLYTSTGQLKHEFVVHKGGRVSDIKLKYGGATSLKLDNAGALIAGTPQGKIKEQAPYTYQKDGKKVASGFYLNGEILSYNVSDYTGELVIDPNLVWATYYGGSDGDYPTSSATSSNGDAFIAGETKSTMNIATSGGFLVTYAGGISDAFMAKFNSAGARQWATYYGGSGDDKCHSMTLDASGNVYLAGWTLSSSGIATAGTHLTTFPGNATGFVAKFDNAGNRIWGTYCGGTLSDYGGYGLAVDGSGNVFMSGYTESVNGIATAGAHQTSFAGGGFDIFLQKFNSSGVRLWGTYYGGTTGEEANQIATDAAGNVYLAGGTSSATGIASASVHQGSIGGASDAFLAKFNGSGVRQWATYYGGTGSESAYAIATDAMGNVYMAGQTASTTGIATSGVHQASIGSTPPAADGFVVKFNSSGVRQWGTYYGGTDWDYITGIQVDSKGYIYLSGSTTSTNAIATAGVAQSVIGGGQDAFVAKLNSNGLREWGTYFGGAGSEEGVSISANDNGVVNLAGYSNSTSGITTADAYQVAFGGIYDAFLAAYSDIAPVVTSLTPIAANPGTSVTITGSNFNTTPANNIVYFGATKATVTAASTTSITATVPVGATFMPVSVNNIASALTGFQQYPFLPTFDNSGYVAGVVNFNDRVNFTASGSNPAMVSMKDIDGDGKTDLAITNFSSNVVSIFRNIATSGTVTSFSYESAVSFATGTSPYGTSIVDIDGDNKPDLIVTNYTPSGTVSVFRNTSTTGLITGSSFASRVDFNVGVYPRGVAVGDIDGDGKPEIIVANQGGDISILRNTSAIGIIDVNSFAAKVDFSNTLSPYNISLGDIDGDGKVDIITGNLGTNTVSAFRNISIVGSITAISLASKVDFTVASGTYHAVVGDFDGDGKQDIAAVCHSTNNVSVLRNTATAGIINSASFSSAVNFSAGSSPFGLALGDLNGDGKIDMVATNYSSNTVSVFRNTATSGSINSGSFATKVDFSTASRAWATYYGGSNYDDGITVATDGARNIYITGRTSSTSGMATSGAHQTTLGGSGDAFLVKFNSAGVRQWATYYGGSGDEQGYSVATDISGNVYLSGQTFSSSGIATSGAYQTAHGGGGGDAFIVKFDSLGVRQWATYFGGSGMEYSYVLATDISGNVCLSGASASTSGIASSGAHQTTHAGGTNDAFLAKFSTTGSLQWSTYYGSSSDEFGYSTAADNSGNVFLAGYTSGTTGLATGGAHQTASGGGIDGFLVKFNSAGVRQWATYYGGSGYDYCNSTAVDVFGNVYVTGPTESSSGMVSGSGYQLTRGGGMDAYLAKFNSSGVRQWGTYYGGSGTEQGYSVATDIHANVYLTGQTNSTTGISSSGAFQPTFAGTSDVFLVKFSSSGSRRWGTYYGSSGNEYGSSVATDTSGNIFVIGLTNSTSGIASSTAHQPTFGGSTYDAFLVRFSAISAITVKLLAVTNDTLAVRAWGTYYGGSGGENGRSVAVDRVRNIYITGRAQSTSAIATSGAHQSSHGGGTYDAYLVKFDSTGVRQWGTFYGGSNDDIGTSVTTDSAGNVYVCGSTMSTSGIATSGAHQTIHGSGTYDGFVVKFNSSGIRQWGTYYGGNNDVYGASLITDISRNVYFVGSTYSNSGIATSGAYQGARAGVTDAFIVKFDSVGNRQWGTYFGGSGQEEVFSIAGDVAGNLYIGGYTASTSGISTSGAFQSSHAGGIMDAFLVKFNSGGARQWGTYYGGSGNEETSGYIATDASGGIYLAGRTNSTSGIATSGGHVDTFGGGSFDAFLVKFDSSGWRKWGTYYAAEARAIATDGNSNVILVGVTGSPTNISTNGGHQTVLGGGSADAYVAKFNNSGIRLVGTYYGGGSIDEGGSVAVDGSGNIFLTGYTQSTSGIASGTAHQATFGGVEDAFLVRFGSSTSLTANGGVSYTWTPGTGLSATTGATISANPSTATSYTVTGTNSAGCSNTAIVTVSVVAVPTMAGSTACPGSVLTVNSTPQPINIVWQQAGVGISTVTPTYASSATTVAGTGTAGSSANQLDQPNAVYVDAGGNIYIADQNNHRIQKWAPGATSGTTVAGTGTSGSGANQLLHPYGVYVDAGGNIYVADQGNNRIQKWAPGATSGTRVAGNVTGGSGANQLNGPVGVFVDAGGNIYVADQTNNRIQKWAPGATSGTTIAGNGTSGSAANQLNNPTGVYVDEGGNIYVSDCYNNRIQKWAPGATSGTTVAGNGTFGSGVNQLSNPTGVYVDAGGNIYVADYVNNRIQKWAPGATSGTRVAGTGSSGSGANQLWYPRGAFVDAGGNIYVADNNNQRIQKFAASIVNTYTAATAGSYAALVTTQVGAVTTNTVTVNALPNAGTITGASSVNAGSTITLSNTTTGGVWSSSSTSVATVGSTGVVTGVAVGTATITYSVSNSCGTSAVTKAVTVNAATASCDAWTITGTAGFSAGTAYYTSIAMDGSGVPYVAYRDVANSNKATVMKFSGGSWVTVGTAGFSIGDVSYISLAIDGSGSPYVAYWDEANSNKATVMKFNGSAWVAVGSAGFSAGGAEYITIAIDGSGAPYVAFQDHATGQKATVMKYNGSSWIIVGSAGFSTGLADRVSSALDGSGMSYVVYYDGSNGGKATVKKYNGSSWVTVGSAGFSAGQIDWPTIAIDISGVPYVAYRDAANSNKATVMKYDGGSWVTVGTAGFSTGMPGKTFIAIDGSGVPYVAYSDAGISNKATVKKLSGGSWLTVGSEGLSAGTAGNTSIAIDGSGVPYVVYADGTIGGKAT
eukprot:gene30161-39358_t